MSLVELDLIVRQYEEIEVLKKQRQDLLEILTVGLEHAEGKGWRSDHVASLFRHTILKYKEDK